MVKIEWASPLRILATQFRGEYRDRDETSVCSGATMTLQLWRLMAAVAAATPVFAGAADQLAPPAAPYVAPESVASPYARRDHSKVPVFSARDVAAQAPA